MEYLDLTGKVVKEGDIVVWPENVSTSGLYLCVGKVHSIEHLPKSVKVHVEQGLSGLYAWEKDGKIRSRDIEKGQFKRFSYTEGSIQHSKLLILSREPSVFNSFCYL